MFTAETIKDLREKHKLTQQQFADELGISREMVTKMEGGSKGVSKATQILLKAFESNRNVNKGQESPMDSVKAVPAEAFMEVPVLVRESRAGYLSTQGDREYISKLPTMLVPREYEKGNYLVVELVGDSMDDGTERSLLDGDKLLAIEEPLDRINIEKLPIKKALFVIATKTEDPVVKQIIEINSSKGMLLCHSWNSSFEDYAVFLEDVIQILKVKKLVERPIRL